MKEIYLDNSATTKACGSAAAEALRIMTQCYGNPSSLHTKGLEAEHELKAAAKTIANAIIIPPFSVLQKRSAAEENE